MVSVVRVQTATSLLTFLFSRIWWLQTSMQTFAFSVVFYTVVLLFILTGPVIKWHLAVSFLAATHRISLAIWEHTVPAKIAKDHYYSEHLVCTLWATVGTWQTLWKITCSPADVVVSVESNDNAMILIYRWLYTNENIRWLWIKWSYFWHIMSAHPSKSYTRHH